MAANCSNWPVGFTPIDDLGQGSYQGYQGGLYPYGLNSRPYGYELRGRELAATIQPLDSNGNVDTANGKIVFIILGTSATDIIALKFAQRVTAEGAKINPKLVIVNAAEPSKTIDEVADPGDSYWTTFVPAALAAAGVTEEQVQVGWFQSGERDPPGAFPAHAITTQGYWEEAIDNARDLLPRLKMLWVTPSLFQGYANPALAVPEPAYGEQGFATKWLTEDRIDDFRLPFLSHFYAWAGATTRLDGFAWLCPTHVQADGRHPNGPGATLIADLLFRSLDIDECARPWLWANPPEPPLETRVRPLRK